MAKIAWASDFMEQHTGYARVAKEVLTRLRDDSDHEVVHFAQSGLVDTAPFDLNGITVYCHTYRSGNGGIGDMPVVDDMEKPDFWLWHFDTWTVQEDPSELPFEPVIYPPIDHDPLSEQWLPTLQQAQEVVPFCEFGARVMRESLGNAPDGFIREPILHGVDTERFHPTDASPKAEGLAPDDDRFVVGIFKKNKGTRWKPMRQFRAFKMFIEANDLHDEAMLYVHTNRLQPDSFDLQKVVQRLSLQGNVKLANPDRYLYGYDDAAMNRLYNTCDVVLNCTSAEGFGLPIVEAMAAGTPPIVNAYSSMPELVLGEEGEVHWDDVEKPFVRSDRGYAVPVWDMEATTGKHSFRRTNRAEHIAATLDHAYHNPDELAEMGEAARQFTEDHCDWDIIAAQWDDYFTDLEERTFSTDEDGIEWEQVDTESDGVGGHGH